jgi:hypothetical protein
MLTPQGQTLTIGAQQTGFISPAGVPQLLAAPPPIFRRDAPRPAPQPTPGAPKTSDSTPPGTVRQIDPSVRDPLRTGPTTISPTAPTTIQTAPSTTIQTAPIQTAPTAPVLQPSPTSPLQTSPLQTSPMLKPGPTTAPMMPPK